MALINLTKSFIDKLEVGTKDAFYFDAKLKGFGVKVTPSNTRTFFVQGMVGHKKVRTKIGTYPALTVDQARELATKKLSGMIQGINPNAEKRQTKIESITLSELFVEYQKFKALKPSTVKDYEYALKCSGWENKPWVSLTRDGILTKHQALTLEIGQAKANLTMRFIRAMLNQAIERYRNSEGKPLLSENPTKILSVVKAWHKLQPRTDYIKPEELQTWWEAVDQLHPTTRDFMQFVLLTGLRRHEAETLKWSDVNFKSKYFTVKDTKNHLDHTLPLSKYLLEMLQARHTNKFNEYVFGSANSSTGHFVEPKTSYTRIKNVTGIDVSTHGLRRSFITIAESIDIPSYALKRLMNHKQNSDVTNAYLQITPERLRVPMQQVTDFVLKAAGVLDSAEIVPLLKKDIQN